METEWIKKTYESRILALFSRISDVLTKDGFKVDEPWEATDEEYCWWMTAQRPNTIDRDNCVDVQFYIVESECREATDDGIAFHMTFTEYGGRILGDFSPFNYTESLWIPLDDKKAIQARFEMFENVDVSNLPNLLG